MAAIPGNIIADITSGNISVDSLTEWTNSVYDMVSSNSVVLTAWNKLVASSAFISTNLSIILLIGALVIAFYGQKFSEAIKFVSVYVVTFCLSACYISPPLNILANLPEWVIPVVVATLCTAFGDYLFKVLALFLATYPAYFLIMNPFWPIPYVGGNQAVAIAAGAVSLIVYFIFRRHLSRMGYALVGGFLTALAIRRFYDYTTFLPTLGKWLVLVVTIAVAIVGYIHQHKTRRRFY